jgi:hypothetical protein
MKKILFILAVFISANTFAQSTAPRWGNGANNDNTGRNVAFKYVTLTETAGTDSVTLNPNANFTFYRVALTDSFYFKSPVVTRSYAGDEITIIASGASGTKLKFAGTNYITAGTATLSSLGRAVLTLVFDGAKWVEKSRVVQ